MLDDARFAAWHVTYFVATGMSHGGPEFITSREFSTQDCFIFPAFDGPSSVSISPRRTFPLYIYYSRDWRGLCYRRS